MGNQLHSSDMKDMVTKLRESFQSHQSLQPYFMPLFLSEESLVCLSLPFYLD